MVTQPPEFPEPDGSVHTVSLEGALVAAVALHQKGLIEAAEAIYRGILAAKPDHADALQFLALILNKRGESAAAAAMLRDAARHAPGHAGIWNNLGNVLLQSGDTDGAVEAYRRTVDLAPDFAPPYNNLAVVHRSRGEHAQAEAAYRTALALDPEFADAWHNLSILMLATRRFEEAVQCGLRAVTLAPRHRFALKRVGVAYAYLGELDKAAEVFRAWLAEEPDNALARHHLAACVGTDVPPRASDAYVEATFDRFAASFDAKLTRLDYRAPGLVAQALREACGADARGLRILDAGCGTGLCGREIRPMAAELVGVDLSAGMLAEAARTGLYDALVKSDLTAYLAAGHGPFDVVLSADTLCYFGALEAFAEAVFASLAPGGILVFTAEAAPEGEVSRYRLHPNGRYQHDGAYIDQALAAAGLQIHGRRANVLRTECARPVAGWIVTAARPAPGAPEAPASGDRE